MGNDNESSSGPPDSIGERIRARRLALRMTQAALAEKMRDRDHRWYQETVHRAENGTRRVTAEELPALAAILGMAPGDLVPGWIEAAA